MAKYNVGNVEISLITRMDEATKKASSVLLELRKLKTSVRETGKEIDKTSSKSNSLDKNLKNAFSVGKIYLAMNYIRRYSQALGSVVKSSIDYVETVNKFQVSMGEMYGEALKFQNKMKDTFGLSKSYLMDFQANFNNIIKGLGAIDSVTAYNLSETLTKMSVDFSSLFNVSMESAMEKFQAALTQQVRPIRSVSGFDITQQTLASVLGDIGIYDRSIASLSQIEKRLLIIIALQKQMANVGATRDGMGDFARTIEQPANQLKILKETLKDVGIAFGNFVLQYVSPALAYINGFFMALEKVLQFVYTALGGESKEIENIPSIGESLNPDSATSGVDKTTQAVKDLKKATTGIDELNIISPMSDLGASKPSGGGFEGIDPRILKSLQDYESGLEKVNMKATEIRDKIMEWLGFTKKVDKETGEVSFELGEGYTKLELIRDILKFIGEFAAITFTGKILTNMLNLLGSKATEGTVIFALASVALGIKSITDMQDAWGKLMDGDTTNDVEAFIKLLVGTGGLYLALLDIAKILGGKGLIETFKLFGAKIAIVTLCVTELVGEWKNLEENWHDLSVCERIAGGLRMIMFAAAGAALAFGALQSSWSLGLAAAAIVAGIASIGFEITSQIRELEGFDDRPEITHHKGGGYGLTRGFATGGFPTRGDYFLANENGKPEYVGSIGGKTAVANTNQIVDGISYGVSVANAAQNRLLSEQNTLLRAILAKDMSINLDGRKVSNQLQKSQGARGFNAIKGGFAYG